MRQVSHSGFTNEQKEQNSLSVIYESYLFRPVVAGCEDKSLYCAGKMKYWTAVDNK